MTENTIADRLALALVATLSAYLGFMHSEYDGAGWFESEDSVAIEANRALKEYMDGLSKEGGK